MASNFYGKNLLRCSRGGHWIPKDKAVPNKAGILSCPWHGKMLRNKAVKRGIKKKDRVIIDRSMSNPHKVEIAGSSPAPDTNLIIS